MLAIQTKFMPVTNHKPSRVKAFTGTGRSVVLSWDHGLTADENHTVAAEALVTKMQWERHGKLIGGTIKGGYVFVFCAALNNR